MIRLFLRKTAIHSSGQQIVCRSYASSICRGKSPVQDRKFLPYLHNQSLHRVSWHCYCGQWTGATKPVTVANVVDYWTQRFDQEGIPEPRVSASLIVAHTLGKKMIHDVNTRTCIDEHAVTRINRLCEERLERCPVQYIIGEWDFHDMTLEMRRPVLIPRTETEELAAYIVEDYKQQQQQWHGGRGTTVLDIGCGSGALSLFLLKELPQTRCVAVDISKAACQLTHRNACKYSLQDRLHIVHGSIVSDEVIELVEMQGPYDIVVSNPPYISTTDMDKLDQQVYGYEDHVALHGGFDGMDLILHILSVTHRLLKPSVGTLWLEVDLSHPWRVEDLVNTQYSKTLKYVKTLQDYTHRDRFCMIKGHNCDSPG